MHVAYSFHYLLIKVHTCGCIIFRFLITVRIVNLPCLIVYLPFEGTLHGLAALKILWRCLSNQKHNSTASIYDMRQQPQHPHHHRIPGWWLWIPVEMKMYNHCFGFSSSVVSCILSHICCAICLILFQVSRLLFIMTFRPQQTEWLKPDKHTKL